MFSASCWCPFEQYPVKLLIISSSIFIQEINHLHAASVLMTVIMILAFLTSIAIARRIMIATSVLKVCTLLNLLVSHVDHFIK
jgi:hypothetical protein